MPRLRTLLVSEYAPLIRTVQQAHDSCDYLQLEICGPLAKAANPVVQTRQEHLPARDHSLRELPGRKRRAGKDLVPATSLHSREPR